MLRAPRPGADRKSPRAARVVVAGGILVAAVSLLVGVRVALDAGGGERAARSTTTRDQVLVAAQRASLEDYETALEPLAHEGGRVVVEGLRAGLSDLSEGGDDLDPVAFAERAESWARALENVKQQVAALEVPADLAESHRLRLHSLDGYVTVARKLGEAARAQGAERERLLDEVPPLGDEADSIWDRADELVDDYRRRLGLPVRDDGLGAPLASGRLSA